MEGLTAQRIKPEKSLFQDTDSTLVSAEIGSSGKLSGFAGGAIEWLKNLISNPDTKEVSDPKTTASVREAGEVYNSNVFKAGRNAWNGAGNNFESVMSPSESTGYYYVEATFDDIGGDHVITNSNGWTPPSQDNLYFTGNAHRSNISEGKYGRAAVFTGKVEDAVTLPEYAYDLNTYTFIAWIKTIDNAKGWIFSKDGSYGLRLNAGEIEIAAYDSNTSKFVSYSSGIIIPADNNFHHLIAYFDVFSLQVYLQMDFGQIKTVGPIISPPVSQIFSIGREFNGMIDELYVREGKTLDYFDFNPADCGDASLSCIEDYFVMTPNNIVSGNLTLWEQEEPVRYKIVHDPQICNKNTPCPLLFLISGGGSCADDYSHYDLGFYAKQGFVVATIDPYCESSVKWNIYPVETSQFIAVKNRIFNTETSPLIQNYKAYEIIKGTDYSATGCSHGAGSVAQWTLNEKDYPTRIFSQSAVLFSAHCAYHNVWCKFHQKIFDEGALSYWASEEIAWPHDDSDPRWYAAHGAMSAERIITEEFAKNHEVGLSWGIDLTPETPACTDTQFNCFEEAVGFRYSSLRARDRWKSMEPKEAPTGYFIENTNGDCLHCKLSYEQSLCVACFLKHGRAAMSQECPSCLELSEGGPAPQCDIECNAEQGCLVNTNSSNLCTVNSDCPEDGWVEGTEQCDAQKANVLKDWKDCFCPTSFCENETTQKIFQNCGTSLCVNGKCVNPVDVNEDGNVNIKDIQAVIRCIINKDGCEFSDRSDVNGDGNINIKDIQAIIREIIR